MTHEGKLRMDLHSAIVRVMRTANYQVCYDSAVAFVKRQYLQSTFGVDSSRDLGDEELRLAVSAWKSGAIKIAPCNRKEFQLPTQQMIRKIVALGKYNLGNVYGEDWFWKHLPNWTENAYNYINLPDVQKRRASALNVLTHYEAAHVIRVLETIESKVKTYGKDNIPELTHLYGGSI